MLLIGNVAVFVNSAHLIFLCEIRCCVGVSIFCGPIKVKAAPLFPTANVTVPPVTPTDVIVAADVTPLMNTV